MTQNLPAETITISPEYLTIANQYLQTPDPKLVAEELDLDPQLVAGVLQRSEVRGYINMVFFDLGFNNRFRMRSAMDALIKQKFQELEESQTGSTKDISELLALSHKMSMEQLDREIQLEKLRQGTGPRTQTNIQINDSTSKYSQLIQQLLGDKLA
jgi:hypothetical protein